MTAYPSAPVDAATADLLDLIASDRLHADDSATVVAAIRATAAEHAGVVDPNRVRALLRNEHGSVVTPQVIGATYQALAKAGVLVADGWVITEGSTSGNNGRPARRYRLVAS
jgi:hypothetical protein